MHFLSQREAECRESDLGRYSDICCYGTASWATNALRETRGALDWQMSVRVLGRLGF
jgi:hypothetical protein